MRLSVLVALGLGSLIAVTAGCSKDLTLQVSQIDPDVGDIEGGTFVHIRGNGFLNDDKGNTVPGNAKVYFGSRQGEVTRFESGNDMIVVAPGGKPNEVVDVLVIFEGRGEKKLEKAFTFKEKGPPVDVKALDTK
jgi:hypothetical protein